ncbi:hypothetical protein [uncultured Gammaproteobacteria bacterium]|nr:hypothetical protein [uncultured Gammaproteobacteria bacterium]
MWFQYQLKDALEALPLFNTDNDLMIETYVSFAWVCLIFRDLCINRDD